MGERTFHEKATKEKRDRFLSRPGRLQNFLAAAGLAFLSACGSSPSVKPSPTSLCPISESIQQSDPRQENRLVMEMGRKYLLDENTIIELADISVDGKAIFKVYDRGTMKVLDVFHLSEGESIEIDLGSKKITLSVCSVNDGHESGERSASVVSSEPLTPYHEPADAGSPDAEMTDAAGADVGGDSGGADVQEADASNADSAADTGGSDSAVDMGNPDLSTADAGIADAEPVDAINADVGEDAGQPCYPATLSCEYKPAPASELYIMMDDMTGHEYLVAVDTVMPGDGTVKVTMTFNPGLPQCTNPVGGVWNDCGFAWTCSSDNNYDYYSAGHQIMAPFFGDLYTISNLTVDHQFMKNSITLAWQNVRGILNISDSLPAGGYRIRLDDIGRGSCIAEQPAMLGYFDCSSQKIETSPEAIVGPTIDKILPDGTKFMIKVWKTAPGYTFGAQWADMSILSSETVLTDGEHPRLTSPAISGSLATEILNDWTVHLTSDGTGRLLSIELTAPEGSALKTCK